MLKDVWKKPGKYPIIKVESLKMLSPTAWGFKLREKSDKKEVFFDKVS